MSNPRDSVHRFGAMTAALAHPFADRELILADAELDEGGWQQLCRDWQLRLRDDDGQQLRRLYGQAFGDARAALRDGEEPRAVARRHALDGEVPGVELQPTLPAVPSAQPAALATSPARASSSPWAQVGGPSQSGPAIAYLDERAGRSVDATAEVGLIGGPTLPFSGNSEAPALASSLCSDVGLGHTAEVRTLDFGEVTPFDKGSPPPGSASSGPDAAVPSTTGLAGATARADKRTSCLDVASLKNGAVAGEVPFRDPPPTASAPPQVVFDQPHEATGETSFVGVIDVGDAVLPFDAEPDAEELQRRAQQIALDSAPLTLAQLAAVSEELELGDRQTVLERYHLTEEKFEQLQTELADLMRRDPSTRSVWQAACTTYRRWRAGAT